MFGFARRQAPLPGATQLVRTEHAALLQAFHRYQGCTSTRSRQGQAAAMCRALDTQMQLEDQFLDPLLRELMAVPAPIDAARRSREEVRWAISRVRGLSAGDYHYDDAVAEMARRALHHFADVEAQLLPQVERMVECGALVELGLRMKRRRTELERRQGTRASKLARAGLGGAALAAGVLATAAAVRTLQARRELVS